MEKLICEACGSRDLTKYEGYYICNHCQTKYVDKDREVPKQEKTAESVKAEIHTKPTQTSVPEQPAFVAPPKKNSVFKRGFGILFMCLGVLLLLGGLMELSNGHFSSFFWIGALGFLLFNTGFTYKTSKEVLLTKKLKPWQLWLIYLFVVFIFEAFFK